MTKEYKVVNITNYQLFELEKPLNKGWEIERCDIAKDFIIYVLSRDVTLDAIERVYGESRED